jgi:hypothetical protein
MLRDRIHTRYTDHTIHKLCIRQACGNKHGHGHSIPGQFSVANASHGAAASHTSKICAIAHHSREFRSAPVGKAHCTIRGELHTMNLNASVFVSLELAGLPCVSFLPAGSFLVLLCVTHNSLLARTPFLKLNLYLNLLLQVWQHHHGGESKAAVGTNSFWSGNWYGTYAHSKLLQVRACAC